MHFEGENGESGLKNLRISWVKTSGERHCRRKFSIKESNLEKDHQVSNSVAFLLKDKSKAGGGVLSVGSIRRDVVNTSVGSKGPLEVLIRKWHVSSAFSERSFCSMDPGRPAWKQGNHR